METQHMEVMSGATGLPIYRDTQTRYGEIEGSGQTAQIR
jgi:hypothetical protein